MALLVFTVLHSAFSTQCAAQTDSSFSVRQSVPGETGIAYTPEQDSAYKWALSFEASSKSRFQSYTRDFSEFMKLAEVATKQQSVWENIQRNLNIPAEMLRPSQQEVTQHQINIANAQYVPGVLMYPMGTGNLQVNLSDIAAVFGLAEDVSPKVSYSVDETIEVTIVVYSASAIQVRKIFHGIQAPGTYTVEWDGRNDAGKAAGNGDYIAEVRIGVSRIVRKHIVLPAH